MVARFMQIQTMASIIREQQEIPPPWDALCTDAMQLQLAGQLEQARSLYDKILQAAPRHAAANYGLGMWHVQRGRAAQGLPLLLLALQIDAQMPDYWLGLCEALLLSDRSTEAAAALALARHHGLKGEATEQFARRLNQALALAAENSLLAALRQGDVQSARTLACALTLRFPLSGLAWKVWGALLWDEGRVSEAVAAMHSAVRLLPQDAEAHCNLGLTLSKLNRFGAAEACLHKAIDIDPRFSVAHYRLAMTYALQARLAEAEESLRRGLALRCNYAQGDDAQNHSNLLFIMSHNPSVDAEALLAEHRRYGEYVEGPLRAAWRPHANDRNPDRCLKIGFVSGDLYEHSVGQFCEPILAQLTRYPNLQLHAYCSNPQQDALSRRLQAHFTAWHPVGAWSDDTLADRIRDDQIDILIDLSGHTGHNRLPVFARKPAPIQVSWLGYPGTTGLSAMDYYLADRHWLPPGRLDRLFTEKLVYLPDRWAFTPHAAAPPVGPLPALKTGHLTFGSFHRLGKLNASTIHLWSQLLLAVPQATLLMLGIPVDGPDKQLLEQFAAHGIAPERLTCHGRSTMDVYLAFHNQVDVGLDTLPYAGATTTMHSLSMGVPTLTLAGDTSQARAGAGILANIGLDAFIAADAADFVAKARYWAENLLELARLRTGLRARLLQSPGGQPALIAAHFAQALHHFWHRRCHSLPNHSFSTADLPEETR